MTSLAALMTGVDDATRNDVDGDLLAVTRGPIALERRLDAAGEPAVRERYVALLRLTTYPVPSSSAAESFHRAELETDAEKLRRGGNR